MGAWIALTERLDNDTLEDALRILKHPTDHTLEEYGWAADSVREEFRRLTIESGYATVLYRALIEKISENVTLKLSLEEAREEHKQRKSVRSV